MEKIYYKEKSGIICNRYPKDLQAEETDPFIEVEEELASQTYSCPIGYYWAVIGGELKLVADEEYQQTAEFKKIQLEWQISQKEAYLSSTDYVIAKLNELKLEDEEEYEKAKEQYSDVLLARKGARKEINELQAQLAELEAK